MAYAQRSVPDPGSIKGNEVVAKNHGSRGSRSVQGRLIQLIAEAREMHLDRTSARVGAANDDAVG